MMTQQVPFQCEEVRQIFDGYPADIKPNMLWLRALIFDVAASTHGVGRIEELTKWGEPSYITSETKSGSTIRMDWKAATPDHYYLYFNCKTTLVDTFNPNIS